MDQEKFDSGLFLKTGNVFLQLLQINTLKLVLKSQKHL